MNATLTIGDRTVVIDTVLPIEIAKAGDAVVTVDLADLPDESIMYGIRYGFKQSLNDAAAGTKADEPDNVLAAVNKRLDNLKAGTVRATGGRTGDPVKAKAIAIAIKHAPKDVKKMESADQRKWALGRIAANPAYMELAVKQLAEEAALIAEIADQAAE